MEEENGDGAAGGSEKEVSTMKFSFMATKTKFSASRPPVFPKGKGREMEEKREVEFVTAFGEQGIVAKDPKGLRGARVIPKLENFWRPEKRMKNIMMESDLLANTDERFQKEEAVLAGANPTLVYGLTVAVPKADTEGTGIVTEQNGAGAVKGKLTFAEMEDERLRQDLISLPDEADLDAYDDMPVEDFGEAILRGMGWEKGKPIGRNCKVAVVPVEYVRRSGRTGLGAESAPKEVNNKRQIKPGETRSVAPELVASVGADGKVRNVVGVDEKLVERSRKGVLKGKVMSIIFGRHLGLRGEVLDSESSDRVSVKLSKSGEKVVVTAKDLADIGSVEEEKVLKQIRQLRIGNGEAFRRDEMEEDQEIVDTDRILSKRKEEKRHGRTEDRRESRREKDHRRDERVENGLRMESRREDEERSSRSRRDSRRDVRADYEDQQWSSRDGRRERKRDEYERASENMEVDDEGRVSRVDDRRGSGREHKREERREYRRDGRRDDERERRERRRSIEEDERVAGEDRRPNHKDSRVSENGGHVERIGSGTAIEERYNDAWLTSQIRVRIISKTLKGGKFYLKKGRIVDVVTPLECDILLDESGEILQHVKQSQLETALPKRGGRVMVVGGQQRGLLGKLIERDSEGEVGLMQMEESFEMMTLNLDLLAEFVGDVSERES